MEPNYRRCVSCRRVAPKQAFWRVVRVYPSRQVQLDWGMGRSAYLCPAQNCLQAAQKKNRLGNALKTVVSPEIYQILWQRLSSEQAATNPTPSAQTASDVKNIAVLHPYHQSDVTFNKNSSPEPGS